MVEAQIINNNISLVKAITKEELLDFAKEYLKKHAFISSKKLATSCLYERFDITYKNPEYMRISKSLSHRFRHIIMLLNQERLIVGYNNNSLYKRVDLQESNNVSNIAKSLSNGKSQLIYYQGRFVNPKFYDLE